PSMTSAPTSPAVPSSPFHSPLDFDALMKPQEPINLGDWVSLSLVEPSPPAAPIAFDAFEVDPTIDPLIRPLGTEPFDAHVLKRQFPILDEPIRGKRLVWLDNAATTQKPQVVIDRLKHFYEHENSNIHRAAHTLAARATDAYEAARESVRRFIHAPST